MQRVTFPAEATTVSAVRLVAVAAVLVSLTCGSLVGRLVTRHNLAAEAGTVLAQLPGVDGSLVTISELRSPVSQKRWVFATVSRHGARTRHLLYVNWTGERVPRELRGEREAGHVVRLWVVAQAPWHEPVLAGALDVRSGVCTSGVTRGGAGREFWVAPSGWTVAELAAGADGVTFDRWQGPGGPPQFAPLPAWATRAGGEALRRFL